jgi:hypothetical protein
MEVSISEDGFLNMLQSQNGGALVDELDREMVKGIQAIFDHGGTAELTIKLKFSRLREMETALSVKHDVVAKHPKEERPSRVMFITKGSGLSDDYQEQEKLDLGEPVAPVRNTLAPVSTINEGKK